MKEKVIRSSYEMGLSELIKKQTPLDVVTAIIYYSEVKKLTEIDMLNFLEDKKKEGKNPKFFKELYLPEISNFSTELSMNDFLSARHDYFSVNRTPEAKKIRLKRIKEVFDFKERIALKELGNQFKKIIQKEQGK